MFDTFDLERDRWTELQKQGRRFVFRYTVAFGGFFLPVSGMLCHYQPSLRAQGLAGRLITVFLLSTASYGLGYVFAALAWQRGIRLVNTKG